MTAPSERKFLADVLKLSYGGSDKGSNYNNVQGLGMSFDIYRSLNEIHYAATSPDILNPLSNSNCVMRYGDGRNAAVAYSGRDYRCLTMGFPFECIKDEKTRNSIMKGLLNYLLK